MTRHETATRIETLHTIYGLRRLAKPRDRRSFPGQERMLEIAEVAYVLRADGFTEPAVFERLERVYGTAAPADEYMRRLDQYVLDDLRAFDPKYLKLGRELFQVAFEVACLWAELNAGQVVRCGWPHADQLREAWDIDAYTGIVRTIPKGGDRRKMKPFPKFTRSLADIDILLSEYSGEAAAGVRRWKARAVPGDVLHGFTTGGNSWRLMMGTKGIALVRGGRGAIDYVRTSMN
ncbi:MAG TPA: hypothetical protein VGF29_20955 [Hyphomicrobiaceae bacterium]|jgi:hypothetical protein